MQKRRLLNRKLTATLKRMPRLWNLNPEPVPTRGFKPLVSICFWAGLSIYFPEFLGKSSHAPAMYLAPPPRCGVQDGSSSCGTVEEAKKGPVYNRLYVNKTD
ncbi:uncharacterized protein LOC142591598 [Dermacentor variabilis]|uniref:uncharacterized protein LOC142591598 n=1 Tax=Dermacentor variabilis TaxID=34621 RepID=UPI003F5C462B